MKWQYQIMKLQLMIILHYCNAIVCSCKNHRWLIYSHDAWGAQLSLVHCHVTCFLEAHLHNRQITLGPPYFLTHTAPPKIMNGP